MSDLQPGDEPLRIAIVSPPWYPIPPKGYGGIELVVYLLARELQEMGHSVTVFTCEGSSQEFKLEVMAPESWTADLGNLATQRYRDATYAVRVYRHLKKGKFDLIHEHTDPAGLTLASMLELKVPVVSTVHGPLPEPQVTFYKEIDQQVNLIAISKAQAAAADIKWAGVVHNAVDTSQLRVGLERG